MLQKTKSLYHVNPLSGKSNSSARAVEMPNLDKMSSEEIIDLYLKLRGKRKDENEKGEEGV